MNTFTKRLGVLMAAITLFTAFAPFGYGKSTVVLAASAVKSVMVQAGVPLPDLEYDSHSMGKRAFITIEGTEYPAFCVDPNLPGADSHPDSKYPIEINGTNMSAAVATVLHNSYPYVTVASIQAQYIGITELQIYTATKAAVRFVDPQCAHLYGDETLLTGDPQTVKFAKDLIALANSGIGNVPESAIYGPANTSSVTEETVGSEIFFVRTADVKSSNYPLTSGTKIKLSLPPGVPSGTKITMADGSPIPDDGVGNSDKIKIWVPKLTVTADGSFNVTANLTIDSAVILSGIPESLSDKGNYQRYEVALSHQPVSFTVPMEYKLNELIIDDPVVPAPKKESSTTPPAGHPSKMHRRANSTGNVAKCPPRYAAVLIRQMSRAFRVAASFAVSSTVSRSRARLSFCAVCPGMPAAYLLAAETARARRSFVPGATGSAIAAPS